VEDLDRAASAITSAIHPQAVAWWVVAALAAATFLVATGQALARQVAADDRDGAVLTAIGLRSGQFTSLHALRTLVIAVAGTVAGVGVATLLSPLTPVGEARLATPTPGLVFDWPVALAGGAAATAAVLLLGLPPALRSARRQAARRDALVTRQSRVTRAAAAAGLPAAAVLGIRQAFSRGRGANAAPVGTGLTGAVAAVTALCVIAVFGASLSHLLASPELYGDPYTAFVNSGGPGAPPLNHVLSGVEHDRAVDRITEASTAAITVNHVSVRAVAAQPLPGRGPMLLSTSDGLLPTGNGEIELGSATMRSAGAHVGGTVQVTVADPYGKPQTTTLRVVGTGPFPADLGSGGIGEGATLTYAAYQAAQCPGISASGHAQCLAKARQYPVNVVLLHTVPGPAGDAAIARITAENPGNVTLPAVPTTLASFGESANFPLIVAVVVALGGLAALAHLLAVSVARRRRESGLLKALGFARPQLAATVFWQAVTVGLVGLVLGIPLGLVLGRAIWRLFGGNLGVVPFTVYPGWLLAAIAGGFLLASLVIAVLPARSAARAGTSQLLRAE
jgi:ABC-type lipoprotein release transport system permease subunit